MNNLKISEIVGTIDNTPEKRSFVDLEKIGEELGIEISMLKQERLKSFWIEKHESLNKNLGSKLYFLDGEPVCISIQRKFEPEFFRWFSMKAASEVKYYLETLLIKKDTDLNVKIIDMNKDIKEFYEIHNFVSEEKYCTECGEDQDIGFIATYANGDFWKCRSCGNEFSWNE